MTSEIETSVSYRCERPSGSINGIFDGIDAKSRAFARIAEMEDGSCIIERTMTTEHDTENSMHALDNSSWEDREIYRKGQ